MRSSLRLGNFVPVSYALAFSLLSCGDADSIEPNSCRWTARAEKAGFAEAWGPCRPVTVSNHAVYTLGQPEVTARKLPAATFRTLTIPLATRGGPFKMTEADHSHPDWSSFQISGAIIDGAGQPSSRVWACGGTNAGVGKYTVRVTKLARDATGVTAWRGSVDAVCGVSGEATAAGPVTLHVEFDHSPDDG